MDKDTKAALFLWGFDGSTGKPYVDAMIMINSRTDQEALRSIHMFELRSRFASGCNVALLHIPRDFTREDIESYVASAERPEMRDEVIKKLNAAKVNIKDLIRTSSSSSAVEGIIQLFEDPEGEETL